MPSFARRTAHALIASLAAALAAPAAGAADAPAAPAARPAPSKPATPATRAANAKVLAELPFDDRQDFEDAQRGLIDSPRPLSIASDAGPVAPKSWDLEPYRAFIGPDRPAPDTVNPSLWRNARLNVVAGLFEVTDRIYQVRGFDISNITFVRGDTGWIVFDPLITVETARAAYELVTKNLGKRPVVAVVYSHSHIDHFGGVRGVVDEADVKAGKVQILAPEGFLEHAVSENVVAGNAMSRRAVYMFGALLPVGPTGAVSAGLGVRTSYGTTTLIAPTREIRSTGEEVVIDGVRMVFQMTPGTEAPAEMNTWFPDLRALWMAENTTHTLHNVLTLRGAPVRDALLWSSLIDETIRLYGADAEVKFQSHHWPVWGNARVVDYLRKQRDLYRYLHDQTVRLMNLGYTGPEIAEQLKLPPELERFWPGRGHYGTLRHNSRAVYQRYMGWYDGNPANLNPLPPVETGRKFVEYMGGEAAAIARARRDYANGEYRWVAQVMKEVVFANPDSAEARNLLADAFEQLAYQAESGPWRAVYLQGASELRNGVPRHLPALATASPDIVAAMPPELLFDYLAVRLNGERAAGKKLALNLEFTDLGRGYGLTVGNGVLNHGPKLAEADATLTLAKSTLAAVQLGRTTLAAEIAKGAVKVAGRPEAFGELMGLLDTFPPWFDVVTP